MEAILNANCPRLGEYIWNDSLYWRTCDFIIPNEHDSTSDRGREIKHWIQNHETDFANFCVIDDMADMRPVQSSLVKCDAYDGMGWHQYRIAEKMLMATAE